MSVTTEMATCPKCSRRVRIRQNGLVQNHAIRARRRTPKEVIPECHYSGVDSIVIKMAAKGEGDSHG